MVLAEAFMKRNDLKKQIALLTKAAGDNLWQDKSLPINFDKGTKVNPAVAYEKAITLMGELKNLNIAIAEANQVNSATLRDLETTTAQISLMESVLQAAERYPGDKQRERDYVEGGIVNVVRENEWLVDPQALRVSLDEAQKHKRDLEKKLAHNNFVTEVVTDQ
jgi:hypothetical protein